MASSKVRMQAKHGLYIMPQSTARVLAMTVGIPWWSYWKPIAMEVPTLVARWRGLMPIVSQAESEPEEPIPSMCRNI